jgi:hypothetical protein
VCDEWYCVNTSRSWVDIWNGAIMSAVVGLVCMFVFALVRERHKAYRTRVFHPRVTRNPPPLPPADWTFLWGWIVHVVRVKEQALYDTAGLDVLYFDRSNRLCFLISLFVAVVNLCVVLPVNYKLGTVITPEATSTGGMMTIDKISMTNIPVGSPLLWVHTLVVVVTVYFVSFLLYLNFVDYRADRQAWLGHSIETDVDEDDEPSPVPTPIHSGSSPGSGPSSVRSRGSGSTRITSLLHRQLSRHVHDDERALSEPEEPGLVSETDHERSRSVDSCLSKESDVEISEVHSPVPIDARQHVYVKSEGSTDADGGTFAVKAQQYAVLVTNVDPSSRAIRNPGNRFTATQAAEMQVSRTFARLFDDFVATVPVRYHAKIDVLLTMLDQTQLSMLRLDERLRCTRPTSKLAAKLASRREKISTQVEEIFAHIQLEQKAMLNNPRSALSHIVIFKSQVSAAVAAQTLLQEPGGDLPWNVSSAPAPDDVNSNTLWLYPGQKWFRSTVAAILIAGLVVFPIGIFTSSMVSLSQSLCAKGSSWHWDWYCKDVPGEGQAFFVRLLTAWVPSLLLALWNAVVIPYGFAFIALFQGAEVSLSGIDRKVFTWFYLYNALNVLAGGMLAGTLFSQLENIIKTPGSFFNLIGHALPQSAGFFISYVSTYAFMLEPLRLLLPHLGVLTSLFTSRRAKIERDIDAAFEPKTLRLGAQYGGQQLILLLCLVFSTASPLITAAALVYFTLSLLVKRYHITYIFVRSYESGATLFPSLFSRILVSLLLYQIFMSAYLLIKEAYTQAFVLWLLIPPFLWQFHSYCLTRFITKSTYLPLVIADKMPVASIPLDTYDAPQVHPRFKAWSSDVGKVWQGYGGMVKKFA